MKTIDDLIKYGEDVETPDPYKNIKIEYFGTGGPTIDAGGVSLESFYSFLKDEWSMTTETIETLRDGGWTITEDL